MSEWLFEASENAFTEEMRSEGARQTDPDKNYLLYNP